jgi:hypothetical protein
MKITTVKKSIASLGAAVLVASLSVVIAPTASAAAPVCATTKGIETCNGTLANGAAYRFMMPSNFSGTMFFWEHGFKPTFPIPQLGVTVPKGIEEMTPASASTGKDVTVEMLRAGHALAAYDGVAAGQRGWNNVARVEMLKEVFDEAIAKYGTKIKKKVLYGSSQAGSIVTPFVEKYPKYADALGILAGTTPSIAESLQSACDLFYILSIFADPTIRGCAAFGVKGLDGHRLASAELLKVVTLLQKWSVNYGTPGLEYPATIKPLGIPQRSALLLTGLLVGIPTKSAHMDGVSTSPPIAPGVSGLIAEGSINSTVAILENMVEAAATGVLSGQSVSEITGPGFYDNTKTDFAALLDEVDSARFNLGLSGDDAIAAMLGTLALAPRVAGNADAIAKFKALDKSTFTSKIPTITLSNEADRLVFPGNSVRYVDRKRAVYEAELAKWEANPVGVAPTFNTVALYAMTPEVYTKFTATTAPDLTAAAAVSGVGHQSFTTKQTMAWVRLLAISAQTGKVPSERSLQLIIKRAPYLNDDLEYRPAELKYDFSK